MSTTWRTTASILRFRSGPAIGNNIIGKLPYGTLITELLGNNGEWLRAKATLSDGDLVGWVSRSHVERVSVSDQSLLNEPPWLPYARAEIGVVEYPGPEHNPRIIEYLRSTSNPATSDETPWCSGFVNWCMLQAKITGTGSALARSWLGWGRELKAPEYGCIVVFDRSDPHNPDAGHVGFYLETTGPGLQILGGNQQNKVCITSYASRKVLSYRTTALFQGSFGKGPERNGGGQGVPPPVTNAQNE
ncbi:MAG: TIGR02594 family protein [Flavobacteriales bacterium]|nr:TIGR02594 family protein [Flavobacteriales bacterium]